MRSNPSPHITFTALDSASYPMLFFIAVKHVGAAAKRRGFIAYRTEHKFNREMNGRTRHAVSFICFALGGHGMPCPYYLLEVWGKKTFPIKQGCLIGNGMKKSTLKGFSCVFDYHRLPQLPRLRPARSSISSSLFSSLLESEFVVEPPTMFINDEFVSN